MSRKTPYLFVFAGLCAVLANTARADVRGMVVAIDAGDKVTVLASGERLTLRLGDIDAPEPGQPFSASAMQSLAGLCLGKAVTIENVGIDLKRGIFGDIACEGVDAEAEQVRRGMAWVSVDAPTDSSLRTLEAEARAEGAGLWSDSEPVPPWTWGSTAQTPRQER